MSVYNQTAISIDGTDVSLEQYRGSVLLIVNVASRCAFTSQYSELQRLYEQYRESGFAVLGFPCNQFGSQEPKSNDEIQTFCSLTYHVTFPMFSKIEVNGKGTHPLFVYLKSHAKGLLGSESIKWNFTKFLVGRDGKVIERYSPAASPMSLTNPIERALSPIV
ncbi:MAG: glutathione peroxidase [Pirellula sp.]